jgi:hypothetical protein
MPNSATAAFRRSVLKQRGLFRVPTFNRWAGEWLPHWRNRQRQNAIHRREEMAAIAGVAPAAHPPSSNCNCPACQALTRDKAQAKMVRGLGRTTGVTEKAPK